MTSAKILLIETSSRSGAVGLASGTQLLRSKRLEEARRHNKDLVPAIDSLFKELDWHPRDINAVFVSHGPGSYTGLRVGIMSAKTFAYVTSCQLLAIPTMTALAHQVPQPVAGVDVFVDAQQDRVYWQRFIRPQETAVMTADSVLCIRPFSEWLADPSKTDWVTGPGLRGKDDRLPENVKLIDSVLWQPRLESLLQLGWPRFSAGDSDDLWTLEPLYLRPSAAEEQWEALGK